MERTRALFAASLGRWVDFSGSLETRNLIQYRTIHFKDEAAVTQYRSKCAVEATVSSFLTVLLPAVCDARCEGE